MSPATHHATNPLKRRIALVFDFDDTLAPDSVTALVESLGHDSDEFWDERVQPRLDDGWDPVPAAFWSLIELSRQRDPDDRLTHERLVAFGEELEMFEGVEDIFDRLREVAREVDDEIELEFYMVTAGVEAIAQSCKVADQFDKIWGCRFHYDEDTGEIEFLSQIISHTEKTRYLFHIARGPEQAESRGFGRQFEVERDIDASDLHVPLSQIIYVGDGLTDIPCFSLLHDSGGVALGVYKERTAERWGEDKALMSGERVENLARAEYGEEDELMRSLELAVGMMARRIALREMSKGE